jgi:hypothetical protein
MTDYLYRVGSISSGFTGIVAAISTMDKDYLGIGFVLALLFAICDGVQHA